MNPPFVATDFRFVVPVPAAAEIPDERYAALDQLSLRVLQALFGREQRKLLGQQILFARRAGEANALPLQR